MIHRITTLVCLLASLANAHVRWQCPVPRSQQSAIKQGPCGVWPGNSVDIMSNEFSKVDIQPGPLTVTFEETIPHRGSPVRIALSQEGIDDYEDCILLNHVPHYDGSRGGSLYTITIDIPDVRCENCALQLIQVMTDKIPAGTNCTYDVELSARSGPGNCFSNYHSCSNVRINGSIPRDQFTCAEPADWPFQEGFQSNEYTRTETGNWGPVNGLQLGPLNGDLNGGRLVPSRFNALAAGCDSQNVDNGGVEGVAPPPNNNNNNNNNQNTGGDVNTQQTTTTSSAMAVTTMIGALLAPAVATGAMSEMSGVLALYSTYATYAYISNSLLSTLL